MVSTCDNFDKLAKKLGTTDKGFIDFCTSLKNGDITLKEGQTYLQAYQEQLNSLGFSFSKIKSMAGNFIGNLGANVLNALGGMAVGALAGGLMTLAGKGIEWVYKKISGKAAEEAKQKIREVGEEARNAADEIKSNFESTKSTVDDISDRYAELAQGVQNLGKATQNQGKLSNDDYKEFLDLSNQLAELFPQLTSGYDDNGNAVLKLDGSVQNITTSIYSYVDALETANSIELQNKFDDIWKSYNQDMKDYSDQAQEAQNNSENLVETYQHLDQILSSDSKQGNFLNYNGTMMPQILSEANIDLQSVRDDVNGGYDFSILTEKQIQAIKDAYVRLLKEYNNDADYFASQVETTNKNVANYIISSLQGDQMMQEIEDSFGDNGISLINGILSNLNYNELYGDLSGTELIEQIKQDFIYNLSSLSDSDTTKVKTAWNNLLSIDTNAALEENIPKIEAYIKQIADLLDIDWTQLAPALGYDIDASKKQIQDLKDRMGYSHKSGYALSNKESDVNQKINDLTQRLTQNELDVLVDVELPSNVLNMTEEEFKAWIQKLQDEAVIDVETRTASDAVDSLADIKSALSSLEELYSQTVSQDAITDGIVNGFASPDTLNAVESAFGGIAEEDAKVADALEAFEETMVKFPNDSAKAQSAINDLITAYIDQTDIIKDLTDENKDYAKAQLKAMGITNAEEVVESRLTDTNKKLSKGYSELAKNVQEYNDAVDSADVSKQQEQIQNITDKLNDMYKTGQKDVNGQEVLPFDTNTVLQNMDTIKAATQGDIDAMNQLAIMAGKSYIAHLQIDGDTHTVDAMRNNLYSLISQLDGANIAIGTSMDNSPIIQGLIAIGQQAKMTSDQIADMIKKASGGTISADVESTTVMVDMPTLNMGIMTPHGLQHSQNGYEKKPVKIPKFKYKYTGAGGTKANYGGGGVSSSKGSGGSGGGGGGSSSEPQEDDFDWIEVAINRAEEQISRLDKVVENTYDKWTNRSKALNDEISKTADEMKLQQQAYQGYIDKANSIGLSDSYKQKVQNGTKKIEADIAKDPANKDLIDRKEELIKAQRDVILSANDEKKSMIDLARDGYDAMLEVLQELIDKRKEYLDNEKSIYEYQQTISEKAENLASLRKQLSVFENDNSEESLKKVQQLQSDIKDAEKDLKISVLNQIILM